MIAASSGLYPDVCAHYIKLGECITFVPYDVCPITFHYRHHRHRRLHHYNMSIWWSNTQHHHHHHNAYKIMHFDGMTVDQYTTHERNIERILNDLGMLIDLAIYIETCNSDICMMKKGRIAFFLDVYLSMSDNSCQAYIFDMCGSVFDPILLLRWEKMFCVTENKSISSVRFQTWKSSMWQFPSKWEGFPPVYYITFPISAWKGIFACFIQMLELV